MFRPWFPGLSSDLKPLAHKVIHSKSGLLQKCLTGPNGLTV